MKVHQLIKTTTKKNGFTLVELVASIAIFGMLTVLLIVSFQYYNTKTKVRKKAYTQNLLNRLVTQYYKDHLDYPTENQLIALINRIYPNKEDINTLKNDKCLQNADPFTNLSQLGWQADNNDKISIILDACP